MNKYELIGLLLNHDEWPNKTEIVFGDDDFRVYPINVVKFKNGMIELRIDGEG